MWTFAIANDPYAVKKCCVWGIDESSFKYVFEVCFLEVRFLKDKAKDEALKASNTMCTYVVQSTAQSTCCRGTVRIG